MESEILISFVVPAYNAEDTLKKCVQSITASNDKRIEIIIIENGSTDNTLQIAKELASLDSRIKVFISEKGVSNARNFGIEKATGKWMVFVDADDRIINKKIKYLIVDAEEKDVDLVLYGHRKGTKLYPVSDADRTYKEVGVEQARIEMIENPTRYMQVWAKLFKLRIIRENQIIFDNRIRLSEDSDFMLRYGRYCGSIKFSSECIYQYTLNPVSTMRLFDGSKVADYIIAIGRSEQFVLNESDAIKKAFQKYILMHMYIIMVRDVFNCLNRQPYVKKYKKMTNIMEMQIFAQAIANINMIECINIRMLPLLFTKLKLYHLACFVFIVRSKHNYLKEKKASKRIEENYVQSTYIWNDGESWRC